MWINKSHDSMFSCDEAIPYPTGVSEDLDCSSGEFLEKVGPTVVSNQMQGMLNFSPSSFSRVGRCNGKGVME